MRAQVSARAGTTTAVWRLESFTPWRNRVFRSTSVATWLLFDPITRSRSRCPDSLRFSAAWGRSSIGRAARRYFRVRHVRRATGRPRWIIGRVAVHVREAIARHNRRVEVDGSIRLHVRQDGLLGLFGWFASPNRQETLSSCAFHLRITQPGTLFDPHIP